MPLTITVLPLSLRKKASMELQEILDCPVITMALSYWESLMVILKEEIYKVKVILYMNFRMRGCRRLLSCEIDAK